jgi:hypothetical protein
VLMSMHGDFLFDWSGVASEEVVNVKLLTQLSQARLAGSRGWLDQNFCRISWLANHRTCEWILAYDLENRRKS